MDKPLVIADKKICSRLFIGTGKFPNPEIMRKAVEASGAGIVTVALRRVDFNSQNDKFIEFFNKNEYTFLPNTSGARSAEEAIRIAKLARAAGAGNWLKLEVTPDPNYLLPDPIETLKAAEILVRAGFVVLPYINADPILALKLQAVGVATVMPLGSPIGSHQGLKTKDAIKIIIEQARVPVVVDAGLGAPSHAAEAMELGADAVLVNTAIAVAPDPVLMAKAFKKAVIAGREGYLAGIAAPQETAAASSPLTGFLR
ncbi:thiazole synthase [Candidatus Margulisiibacteriota bacterium]